MSFLFSVTVFVLVLGILVFVHEAGHFIAAKAAGIHVHRFSLGLGSPIKWLTWRRKETEYSISWLPLGGYVKMATAEEEATSSALEGGTDDTPVPPGKMFEAKPVWVRMVVILAGVTMNAVFAWVLYVGSAYVTGEQIDPTTTVGRVLPDSLPPAAEPLTSIRAGDRIVAVSGAPVASWNDIVDHVIGTSGDSLVLSLADGRSVALPIGSHALGDRARVLGALVPYRRAVVDEVRPGRPGERAGLKVGDTLLAVNGDSVAQWLDFVERIRANPGHQVTLDVARAGSRLEFRVTPDSETEPGPGGVTRTIGLIGVVGPAVSFKSRPLALGEAIAVGTKRTLTSSTQIIRTVQGLLSGQINRRELGGPILIGQMAAQSARLGLDVLVEFMALLSVNLAVLNLLPIPVLDGGQFLFLLAEAVIRRPLSLQLRERLTVVGLVLIVLLMVLAFSNDIRRLLGA